MKKSCVIIIVSMFSFLMGCAIFKTPYPYGEKKGCVKGNCVDGTGVYVYSDYDMYEGGWKNAKYHGQGTIHIVDNGDWEKAHKRIGTWDEGKKHGIFRYVDDKGNSGISYWRNDTNVTSYVSKCQTAKTASGAYKGVVTFFNALAGAARGGLSGAVEGGAWGHDAASNQSVIKAIDCTCDELLRQFK